MTGAVSVFPELALGGTSQSSLAEVQNRIGTQGGLGGTWDPYGGGNVCPVTLLLPMISLSTNIVHYCSQFLVWYISNTGFSDVAVCCIKLRVYYTSPPRSCYAAFSLGNPVSETENVDVAAAAFFRNQNLRENCSKQMKCNRCCPSQFLLSF